MKTKIQKPPVDTRCLHPRLRTWPKSWAVQTLRTVHHHIGSNKLIGLAIAFAANPSSTGIVRLNGVFNS